jgi:formate-dependent nitrite reductase cytochrome c552 subunit
MANIFPKWSNTVPIKVLIGLGLLGGSVTWGTMYYFSPEYSRTGYMPEQPVPYDHSFHVGELGLDCRYCHNNVDKSPHANVPAASTCMSCHAAVATNSQALKPIRESYYGEDTNKNGLFDPGEDTNGNGRLDSGPPVPWVRVHKTPDYAYFNHSIHVNRGISCVECHGDVTQMKEVRHEKALGMAFCLKCHRQPEKALRPLDKVYDLTWNPKDELGFDQDTGKKMKKNWNIHPPTSCTGCHR